MLDSFGSLATLQVGERSFEIHRIDALDRAGFETARLPFVTKVLLENLLRHEDGENVTRDDIVALTLSAAGTGPAREIVFHPSRVLSHDLSGINVLIDMAAMRDEVAAQGGDPAVIDSSSPVEFVIDHAVQVDRFGDGAAFEANLALEYERNGERYAFLKWGQQAFHNLRIVPPGNGICHQVNIEFLARVVFGENGKAFPDACVGTDSHTPMVNGLGVLGWGIGAIEAEAAMLGEPISLLIPEVVGVRFTGALREGVTSTDLVLTLAQALRTFGVIGAFVEFFGAGLTTLSVPERLTIANMAPEYGSTVAVSPIDAATLRYLRLTGRSDEHLALVEAYARAQGLFRDEASLEATYHRTLDFDLSAVEPSLAGPRRPQERVALGEVKSGFASALEGREGRVVVAAITSCTNTSNPAVLIGAGLLAKRAVERGLRAKPWVKTSLAPGSRVVTDYLRSAGLTPYLEQLRFFLVGYGCTTCMGNSGPLIDGVMEAVAADGAVAVAVLSGNRNFEARVHPQIRAAYLASPPLVVAYALAGRVDIDLTREPLGVDEAGKPVYLSDIWPSNAEIEDAIAAHISRTLFERRYSDAFAGDARWRALPSPAGGRFAWDDGSEHIIRPPWFEGMTPAPVALADIRGARTLAMFGDSLTTDHISPVSRIGANDPAAHYLRSRGIAPADFVSYGGRRGNHHVMIRATFAHAQLRNDLVPGVEGNLTIHFGSGERLPIYDAAMRYAEEDTPLIIIAGKEYGTGSSRDWAARGPMLLGVRAVIAQSFERIHRSNLVGMGILPLQFQPGDNRQTLGLTGEETFDVAGIGDIGVRGPLTVRATGSAGKVTTFEVTARLDTPRELDYFRHGGILRYALRQRMLVAG